MDRTWNPRQAYQPGQSLLVVNMRMILALGAALCAGFVSTPAQAWETIDDAAGATREKVNSVTSDGAGNIFTAGTMVETRRTSVIPSVSATWSINIERMYP